MKKYANNGACILPGNPIDEAGLGGMVLSDQVEKAAAENEWADYIVFDGGTNDAYAPVLDMLGDVSQKSVETDTFAGAFRKTVEAIQRNWPKAVVIYVAVHRLGYRERNVQKALHEIALNSLCGNGSCDSQTCMMNVNWILQMKQCAESIRLIY